MIDGERCTHGFSLYTHVHVEEGAEKGRMERLKCDETQAHEGAKVCRNGDRCPFRARVSRNYYTSECAACLGVLHGQNKIKFDEQVAR